MYQESKEGRVLSRKEGRTNGWMSRKEGRDCANKEGRSEPPWWSGGDINEKKAMNECQTRRTKF
jgi:hypothetical protein